MAPRWLVVSSAAALPRREATVSNARERDAAALAKPRFHWPAKRLETPTAAQAALDTLAPAWPYHQVAADSRMDHKCYACKGRPTPATPVKTIAWPLQARVQPAHEPIAHQKPRNACVGVGTHSATSQVRDAAVMRASKGQVQAESGCRFRNDPLCFVSSLVVTKPSRVPGLLLVMTLALLVYAVAQRRLRQQWARRPATVPNHRHQPTPRPTLRGVCQLLEGMHRVRVIVHGQVHDRIEGLHKVQLSVLRVCGEGVCRLYQISYPEGCSMSVWRVINPQIPSSSKITHGRGKRPISYYLWLLFCERFR
jgi:hypothetical protein